MSKKHRSRSLLFLSNRLQEQVVIWKFTPKVLHLLKQQKGWLRKIVFHRFLKFEISVTKFDKNKQCKSTNENSLVSNYFG